MTYKTHLSTGLLFSAIIFLVYLKIDLSPAVIVAIILATILGSSAPDLDTPTGKLWHKIPAGNIIGRIINPIFIGGHRHLSHSILGLGIFTFLFNLLINFLSQYPIFYFLDSSHIIIAFIIGYFSHLIADMFTEVGVPLLFPLGYHFGIPPAPFEKVRIKTGRWFENLIIYPAVNIALIVIIYEYFKDRWIK
jgi:inner membrane protein